MAASDPEVTVSAVEVTARNSAIGVTSVAKSGPPSIFGTRAPMSRKMPIMPKGKSRANQK